MKSYPTGILAFLAALGAVTCAVPASAADDSTLGTWQKHEYTMHFMGFTTTYSCDGLEEKMRELLLWAGAGGMSRVRLRMRSRFWPAKQVCNRQREFLYARGCACRKRWCGRRRMAQDSMAAAPTATTWRGRLRAGRTVSRSGTADVHDPGTGESDPLRAARGNPGDLDLGFEVLVPAESSAVPAKSP